MIEVTDTSFLLVPDQNIHDPNQGRQGWGHVNTSDLEVIDIFTTVQRTVNPKKVIEIGMFAGHSTCMMFQYFHNVEKIVSVDPNLFSKKASVPIKEKFGSKFQFFSTRSANLKRILPPDNYDFMFIDGNHNEPRPKEDIQSAKDLGIKWILVDNVELPGVRHGCLSHNLYDIDHQPKFFFYQNYHRGKLSPGIMGLFKL